MLAALISDNHDDDDVAGFGFNTGWPGLTTLAPLKLDTSFRGVFGAGGGNDI